MADRLSLIRAGLLALLASLVTVAALVGLAIQPADPEPVAQPDLASVLTATVELPRLVRDPRTVAVLVRNHGPSPVRVREVELVSASFEPTGPVRKDDLEIRPGGALALSVVHGEGRCGGELAPPVAPAIARLVVSAGGDWQPVELTLPNAVERLGQRLRGECAAQLVAAAVGLRLEGWSTEPDGSLRTTLVVERRSGEEPITLHQVAGSVLYRLTAPGSPIDTLTAGEDRVEVPMTAEPERCDAHAMADAKFPYLFRTWLSIGELDDVPGLIATDRTGQDQLVEMWHTRCGF